MLMISLRILSPSTSKSRRIHPERVEDPRGEPLLLT
jgi:hypothetical protein